MCEKSDTWLSGMKKRMDVLQKKTTTKETKRRKGGGGGGEGRERERVYVTLR